MQHQVGLTDAQYLDATAKGDVDFVKKFLAINKGADIINARTQKEKFPALSWAIINKQTPIALMIIAAGAEVM